MITPERVLQSWFQGADPNAVPPEALFALWFRSTPQQDQEIAVAFGEAMRAAAAGDLDGWAERPEGRLALILLLDQFPRNAARGTAMAFAGDPQARRHALEALATGQDQALPVLYRVFTYLPLEHAEDLALQERCVGLMRAAAQSAPGALGAFLGAWVGYAEQHRDIIARFGRFPHRNAVLGRPSTEAEEAWLNGGGETFGQGKGSH